MMARKLLQHLRQIANSGSMDPRFRGDDVERLGITLQHFVMGIRIPALQTSLMFGPSCS